MPWFDVSVGVRARRVVYRVLLLCVLGSAQQAVAVEFTRRDWLALPPYCAAKFSSWGQVPRGVPNADQAARQRWAAILGPFYTHVHHLCMGLAEERRYRAAKDEPTRRHWFRLAKGDAIYSLRRIDVHNPAYPAAISLMARLEMSAGRWEEARHLLDEATQARPKSASLRYAYAFLLRNRGKVDEAMTQLAAGAQWAEKRYLDYWSLYGIVALEAKRLHVARCLAGYLYGQGYSLPGLRKRLRKAGVDELPAAGAVASPRTCVDAATTNREDGEGHQTSHSRGVGAERGKEAEGGS